MILDTILWWTWLIENFAPDKSGSFDIAIRDGGIENFGSKDFAVGERILCGGLKSY